MTSQRLETGFTQLYRANYHRVLAFVTRRTGNPSEAEDLTAEVFRLAWTRVSAGDPVSPGWIFVTARNVLRNHHRSEQRTGRLHDAVATALRSGSPPGSTVDAVRTTLAGLAEAHRTVLVLHYWDRLTGREIAQLLGVSVPAVWVRLHRARRAFRAAFQPPTGPPEETR